MNELAKSTLQVSLRGTSSTLPSPKYWATFSFSGSPLIYYRGAFYPRPFTQDFTFSLFFPISERFIMRFPLLQFRRLLALFPLALHVTVTAAQTCYFTDKSIAEGFTPCYTTASATTCCQGGDACITSGLYLRTIDISINAGACTDQAWEDTSCFQGCGKSYHAVIFAPPAIRQPPFPSTWV